MLTGCLFCRRLTDPLERLITELLILCLFLLIFIIFPYIIDVTNYLRFLLCLLLCAQYETYVTPNFVLFKYLHLFANCIVPYSPVIIQSLLSFSKISDCPSKSPHIKSALTVRKLQIFVGRKPV